MTNDQIQSMFVSEQEGDKHNNWKKTGHFCIRFTTGEGNPDFVIVDDYIPMTFSDG